MDELTIRPFDLIAVGLYLVVTIAIAAYFALFRNKTTEDYFVGNRSLPGWAVGLSMLGTSISAATFLALPAAAYILDWRQLSVNFAMPIVAIIAIVVFIPFFRLSRVTSAFEYLGKRYGQIPRLYGTLSFILLQLIRMAQILFLVSLPIQFLTGIPLEWVIVGAGIFIGIYTIAGGISAVIWTDVIQAIVLLFGGLLCIIWVALQLPDGIPQIIDVASAQDKFSLGSFDWDLAERTFWTVLILGIINWLGLFSGEQTIVQRYVAAKSMREARRATLIFAAIALPLWTLFFFLGTSMFSYYEVFPDPAVLALEADQVLPYFILTTIPVIVAGIIVSAVIAAAMSSLDSGINSISTVVVVDLLKPYIAKGLNDSYYLASARWIGAIVTCLVIVIAIFFNQIDKESMNDISLIVTSVFGGCLMGLFMMGFFTTRIDGFSATIAMALAICFNIYLGIGLLEVLPERWSLGIHSYWVGGLVNGTFIISAYIISIIRRAPDRNLNGLTIWTVNGKENERETVAE